MRYMAPDGTPILGERNDDFCAFRVSWADGAAVDEPNFDDSPGVEWATSVYDGCTVWLDEDVDEWLAHHLIPDDREPLSEEAVGMAKAETRARKRVWLMTQARDTYEGTAGWDVMDKLVKHERSMADDFRRQFEALKGGD